MRITEINIPKEKINNGLESVKMRKLGQVILLAGKNGAGKTRLLNLIANTIISKPTTAILEQNKKNFKLYNDTLKEQFIRIEDYEKKIKSSPYYGQIEDYEKKITQSKANIVKCKKQLIKSKEIDEWNLIETDGNHHKYSIIPFVPKSLTITDCNTFRKSEIMSSAKSIDQVGVDSLAKGTFARIQVIQDRWFNSTHQGLTLPQEKKDLALADYNKLKDLINLFLNTNIERSIDGEPTLFGLPLGQSNLSDGQKILLQMCLAIHCQQESLDNLVLFLDEPENHLHPSVIIETIERLIDRTKNGQIWISTHSIPLLSYFDPSNIWYMENNRISYAGNGPEKVLSSLLGDENQIGKLQDFINLPGVLALNRHAFESLFHPEAILTKSSDPQTLQIKDEIKKHLKGDNIRILDYGAGKGRLFANIAEANKEPVPNFIEWFDYVAYDKFDSDEQECIDKLSKVYTDATNRYFNDFSELFGKYDKESFDIVIMCNVLHEIDPNDWLKLFSKKGEIPNLLKENGILLLVEDQEMPIGEKAYQKGFIVLNTAELKELFSIKESDLDFEFSDVKDGRLKAHIINKEYLMRITSESRRQSIKSLHKKASEKILSIREDEINYKNGKTHGFWVQQFANTGLALSEWE